MKRSIRWYKQRTPEELVKINQGLTLMRQEVKFEQLKLNEALTDLVRYPRDGKALAVLGRRYPISSIWEWYKRKDAGI
jgi:hypothetical protein